MSRLIFGRKPVLEALEAHTAITKIYLEKGEKKGSILKIEGKARAMGVRLEAVDARELAVLTEENHQGVVAVVDDYRYADLDALIEEMKNRDNAMLVLLDSIEDPHNLGAIVRTAECAGAVGVVIPKHRAALVTDTVTKVSAGATEYLPIAKVTNLADAIDKLKHENIWVYGLAGEADGTITETDFRGKVAVVIGNEGRGIRKGVREACDALVSIPLRGKIESLNASAAAAVVLYEIVRQHAR